MKQQNGVLLENFSSDNDFLKPQKNSVIKIEFEKPLNFKSNFVYLKPY